MKRDPDERDLADCGFDWIYVMLVIFAVIFCIAGIAHCAGRAF